MKFLLVAINSKYIHTNPAVYSLKNSVIGCPGKDIVVREFTINQTISDIMASIYEEKPDYIGFSCYIWNISMVKILIQNINKILPEVKLFLGGPEVSFHSDTVIKDMNVSAIMVGEGEETFKELINVLPENSSELTNKILAEVAGLQTSDGYTKNREPISLDSITYNMDDMDDNKILYYESSRGCPFRCSYCLSSIDKSLRFRSVELVKKDLDMFLSAKVKQVKFIDRTFNANKNHALQIWKYIQEHDNGITNFHFEIAADLLTMEQLNVIQTMRPGLIQLEIGVQTTNPNTLNAINRMTDLVKLGETVKTLLSFNNTHIHLDLIAGLPYEDYDSFVDSFNNVFNMKPHNLQLGFLKVLKGTEIEEKVSEYEIKYMSEPPYEVLSTKWISYEDILELKGVEEMLVTYYNSGQYTCALPLLLTKYSSPYSMFKSLSDYYILKNYTTKTPARSRRYEILIEFAKENLGSEFAEEIREALTMDYYLREKPKSKPDFVKSIPDLSKIDYNTKNPITGNVRLTQ